MDSYQYKICTKCNIEKVLEDFNKNKNANDGRQHVCRSCEKAYREANAEKYKVSRAAYYEANKEEITVKQAVYRVVNKEEISSQKAGYRETHKEEIAATKVAYREANKEEVTVKKAAYYEANKEEIAAKGVDYYNANKEKIKARAKAWKKANPAKAAESAALGKAKRDDRVPPGLTKAHRAELVELQRQKLALIELTGIEFELDHIVPLCGDDVSGLHVPWNTQILEKHANQVKSNKFDLETYVHEFI